MTGCDDERERIRRGLQGSSRISGQTDEQRAKADVLQKGNAETEAEGKTRATCARMLEARLLGKDLRSKHRYRGPSSVFDAVLLRGIICRFARRTGATRG